MTGHEIPPSAYVKHQLPGRVRLKIPEKKSDFRYFERIAESFADCPGIIQLQLNPPAASLLISHAAKTDFAHIAEFAEVNGLFTITEQPVEEVFSIPNLPLTTLTSTGLSRIDASLLTFSRGRLDGRSALFLALIGLAVHQVTRNNVMAPAASLLWYAFTLLKEEIDKTMRSDNPDDTGA